MKTFIKLLICFALLFVFSNFINAQNSTDEWIHVQSDNGEFSVEMPANYSYFYDKDGFAYQNSGGSTFQYAEMQMLNGSHGKTVMSVEIYKVSSPKSYLNFLLEKGKLKASKINDESQSEFMVKQAEKSNVKDFINDKDVDVSYIARFISSKNYLYIVTVANRGRKTPAFERFLASIRLGESQSGNVKILSLQPLTIENVGEDVTGQLTPIASPTIQDRPKDWIKNPTPLLILSRPFAGYTDAARSKLTAGIVRLRTTLDKDGRVSKISLVSGLPNGLNRSAFFAALRIKFIPEEKAGELETVTKVIEYSFNVY